jgi:hypothetical protein
LKDVEILIKSELLVELNPDNVNVPLVVKLLVLFNALNLPPLSTVKKLVPAIPKLAAVLVYVLPETKFTLALLLAPLQRNVFAVPYALKVTVSVVLVTIANNDIFPPILKSAGTNVADFILCEIDVLPKFP